MISFNTQTYRHYASNPRFGVRLPVQVAAGQGHSLIAVARVLAAWSRGEVEAIAQGNVHVLEANGLRLHIAAEDAAKVEEVQTQDFPRDAKMRLRRVHSDPAGQYLFETADDTQAATGASDSLVVFTQRQWSA